MSKANNRRTLRPGLLTATLHRLYGIWFATTFLCLSAGTLLLVAILPGQTRRRSAARSGARLVFRLTGSWPTIEGFSQLPSGASVTVANHASYLDGILLTAVLPHNYRFVIKREVTKVPLVNFFLQRIGAHFVERFDKQRGASDTRKILQTAESGASLAFFPEGTFRREAGLRRFQNGAFTIAARNSMPVVPLVIRGTRQMLPADNWLPRPARLRVKISAPLLNTAEIGAGAARDYCRQLILAGLDEPDLVDSNDHNDTEIAPPKSQL